MNTNLTSIENIAERQAAQIVAEEFLVARSKILELAATLDRIERGSGDIDGSAQMNLLVQGIHILVDEEVDKAKRVQLLMSRLYDSEWTSKLQVAKRGG